MFTYLLTCLLTYLLTFEVPDAITIGVVEGSRVDLVNNASLPPLQRSFRRHRVAGLGNTKNSD